MSLELSVFAEPVSRDTRGVTPPPVQSGHWLHVVSHLDPRYGGLSTVVPQLASSITDQDAFSVEVAAFCNPDELCAQDDLALKLSSWPRSRSLWLRNGTLRTNFRDLVDRVDGLHIHGLWEQSTSVAATAAQMFHKPYVLSAHGMLEPWALSKKALKKRMYAALFERANLERASCLHALTHAEAADYRQFGCRRPIAVIPNGVTVPEFSNPEMFFKKFPDLRGKRIILFLGRLHSKKGLNLLVDSWSTVAGKWPEAHIVLAGPDSDGTRIVLERRIAELGITEHITFAGMLRGEQKWSALAAAQGFVLPSYSEGLSVSVLEAMGMGLPVIISQQCNFPEVERIHAGWVIQSKTSHLTSVLNEFLSNSREANEQIGNVGRKYVLQQYNWTTVATQMSDLYRWIQGGGIPQTFDLLEK